MKSITKWGDLEEFGINALTGEADRTGTRILCDLTDTGKSLVFELLGIPLSVTGLAANYNSRSKYSMMLPYNLFKDLAVFALLFGKYECPEVLYVSEQTFVDQGFTKDFEITGRETSDTSEEWKEHLDFLTKLKIQHRLIRVRTEQPGVGSRATHHFTGRVA